MNLQWKCGGKVIHLDRRPLIMGIVNVTPDSFSGGIPNFDDALKYTEQLLREGADILDIGGESTRPGSLPVSVQQELDRVAPLVQALHSLTDVPLSIDTQKHEIARETIPLGIDIINHVSGSLDFKDMLPVLKESEAGYVGMHMKARPKIMQQNTDYDHLVENIVSELKALQSFFLKSGIEHERLIFDIGIGFGKSTEQCITLLQEMDIFFKQLGRPFLMGLSRKKWLSELLNLELTARDHATASASSFLPFPEVAVHRVHNVALTRQSLILKGKLRKHNWDWQAPTVSHVPAPERN